MGNHPYKHHLPRTIPSFIRSEIHWYLRAMAEGGAVQGATSGTGEAVSLWAVGVVEFSSQYDNNSWPATSVCGAPRVYPKYGDIAGAWASGNITNHEFVTLKYEEALYVDRLEIYETYNAGAVMKVTAQDKDMTWHPLWVNPGSASHIKHSRIFDVDIKPTSYKTDTIRIELDCTKAGTWCEIDAVKLTGVRTRLEPPPPLTKLSDDMACLVNSEDFSDVTFLVDGHEVKGHRAILSARSEYFRAMFKDETNEFCSPLGADVPAGSPPPYHSLDGIGLEFTPHKNTVKINNIGHEAFLVTMQYLYTNRILDKPSPPSLAEVIRAADMYNMSDLEKMATYQLNIETDADNVISIYLEATQKLPVLSKVERVCVDFIARNLQKVCKTKAFCELPQDVMLNIIQTCTEKLSIS